MRKPSFILLVLCIAIYAAAEPFAAGANELAAFEKARERSRKEAVELFQVVLKTDEEKPAPCEFRTAWLDYPIPASYFGFSISADLVPSDPSGDPAEILDPTGAMREAFCDEADDKLRLSFLVESLKRRELGSEKEPNSRKNSLRIFRREYTFPIFDKNYRRAVIVSTGLERFW